MTGTGIYNSNQLIEQQLSERIVSLEKKLDADILCFVGPIVQGIDKYLRDAIEKSRKKKTSFVLFSKHLGGISR